MQKVGFILFVLGAAGMDSPDIAVPVGMVLVGLAILAMAALKEKCNKSSVNSRENFENYDISDSKTA